MYLISWYEQISGSNVRAGALKTCKKKWRSKKCPEGTMKSLKWVYPSISAAICFHHNTHFNALALVFHFCRLCLCPRFFLSPPLSHDPGAPVMVFPARVSKSTLNFEIGHIRPLPTTHFLGREVARVRVRKIGKRGSVNLASRSSLEGAHKYKFSMGISRRS